MDGRRLLFALMLVLFGACKRSGAPANPPPADDAAADGTQDGDARPFDYNVSTLKNGMQVITLEDHSTPIAAVQVWYHVGSKDERPDRRGFAHMFEHMMFRGTQNIGPKAHFEYIRKVGGDANAYTSFDNTTYIQVVPSNQVEMVLWLEAERMAFLKINEGYFDTERNVVAEEYRLGREQPYGTVPDKLLPMVFKKHPYAWTPIGNMEELAAADAKELQEFWNTFYVPNNAALVVVGDVDHEEIEKQAEQYFGWIPKYDEPPRVEVREPPLKKPLAIKIKERNGPVPILGVAWRTVPMGHKDELALEMLGIVLGQNESSRLYRDLVTDRDLAMFAGAGSFTLEHDGVFGAGAVLAPIGGKPKTVLKAIREHIAKIRGKGISPAELEKARAGMLRSAITAQTTVASKAQALGEAALLRKDLDYVNKRFALIKKLTSDDIKRVATEYLDPKREIEIRIEPNLLGFIVDQFKDKPKEKKEEQTGAEEISGEGSGKPGLERPESLAAKPTVAPPLTASVDVKTAEKTLENGLRVVVVPNDELPLVTFQLGLEYGAFTDPKAKPGVAFLALPMLTHGTKSHNYKELTDELDQHAISIAGGADMDTATVYGSAVAAQSERAMRLLAEVVREPTFPADELEDHVDQTVTGLAVVERTPAYLADRELRRRVFKGHPYARLPEGRAAGLRKVDSKDLSTWWSKHARPDAAVLYIAGAIEADDAFELARKHLGPWKAEGDKPAAAVPEAPKIAKTKIYLVDRPGHQAQIRVGHGGITRGNDQYATTRVLTEVFGGGFNSRLNDTIRVKKGLTYGARGGFYPGRFAGRFTISTFSKNATVGETVRAILEEIERLKKEAPSHKEQTDAISYIVGNFPGSRETPQDLVGQLWRLHAEKLPADFYDRYLEAVRGVSSKDVIGAAKALVDAKRAVIVVVGPAKVLKPQLKQIAPVEVVKPGK